MVGASQLLGGDFTLANALAVLLTTESLLFAAMSLAYSASSGSGNRVRKLPISGAAFASIIAVTISIVAIGAVATWVDLFTGTPNLGLTGHIVAFSIATAIVVQPVLVVLLAFGFRERD